MLKYAFIAGAITVSVPALAQDAALQGEVRVQDTQPMQQASSDTARRATDIVTPAPESDVQGEAESTVSADAATTQATPEQIARLVSSQFATYDKDSTGELDQTQFGEWMVALRSASEPDLEPEADETRGWIGQAFAQADADKSNGVSKEELIGFLAPGAS